MCSALVLVVKASEPLAVCCRISCDWDGEVRVEGGNASGKYVISKSHMQACHSAIATSLTAQTCYEQLLTSSWLHFERGFSFLSGYM